MGTKGVFGLYRFNGLIECVGLSNLAMLTVSVDRAVLRTGKSR